MTRPVSDKPKAKTDKSAPDWERIELDYRAGIKTLRQIASENGLTHGAINKKAQKELWDRDLSARRDKSIPVRLDTDPLDKAGFVYVIYLEDSASERFYKIGMASHFSSRFQSHQCASPFSICVACVYYCGNMRAEERELHAIFAKQRVKGEWFNLSDKDLESIAMRSKLV